jgi:hypothetical protein
VPFSENEMRWAEQVTRSQEVRKIYILGGKSEGTVPLGKLGSRWKYNINMNFKGIWCDGVVYFS